MDAKQLKDLVIVPVLDYLELPGVNQMWGTCAQETNMGRYIKQIPNGPALGIFSTEPATHDDVVLRYLMRVENKALKDKVDGLASYRSLHTDRLSQLVTNLEYATAICRIKYLMAPEKLPDENDIPGMASYWHRFYNTNKDINEQQFIDNYHRYILGA